MNGSDIGTHKSVVWDSDELFFPSGVLEWEYSRWLLGDVPEASAGLTRTARPLSFSEVFLTRKLDLYLVA